MSMSAGAPDPADELAVCRTLYRFAAAIDRRDWDAYRSVFTDEIVRVGVLPPEAGDREGQPTEPEGDERTIPTMIALPMRPRPMVATVLGSRQASTPRATSVASVPASQSSSSPRENLAPAVERVAREVPVLVEPPRCSAGTLVRASSHAAPAHARRRRLASPRCGSQSSRTSTRNLHALEAVLAEIDRESPDELWCLGDTVGYGPRPNGAAPWSPPAPRAPAATTTSP